MGESERDELARPKDLEEVSEMVLETHKGSESAKNSVQNYRKDLWQQGNEIEEIEEELDKIRSKGAGGVTHKDMVDFTDMRMTQVQQDIDARASRLEAQIDTLRENLDELEAFLAKMHQCVQRNDEDVDHLSEGIRQAQTAYIELQDRMSELEDDLEDLRVEQDSDDANDGGWWPR